MSNSPTNQIGGNQNGRTPSDEQMDSLLKDFFRLEVPAELNRAFQRPSSRVEPSLVIAATEWDTAITQKRSSRAIVAATLSLLALSLVMFVQVANDGGSSIATKQSDKKEDLMLVSPKAQSDSLPPITEDGVTLEETDSIELKSPGK
jgi:hypothetical protein